MDSRAMKFLGVTGAACIAALSLAGCSSSPQASTTTTTTKPQSSSGSTPSLPKTVPDNPSLRHDVSMETCQAIAGGWEAGGTREEHRKSHNDISDNRVLHRHAGDGGRLCADACEGGTGPECPTGPHLPNSPLPPRPVVY